MNVRSVLVQIDLIGNIGLGSKEDRSKDILGRVYEYFLSEFAGAEGKKGGQFYTPRCIVRVLVEMLAPYKGRVYDPACGSGGMFVQSEKFIEEHGGKIGDISVYGQESNHTTWRLAKMNLAIRGIDSNLGKEHADSFHRDLTADDIRVIAETYHAWRGDKGSKKKYEDVPGFCKSATLEDIRHHGHILTPGRYVGAAEVEDDGEPFEDKMARLTAELREQTKQSAKLDKLIWTNLEDIGYGG